MDSGPRNLTDTNVLVDVLKDRLHVLVTCLSHSWGGLEQVSASDAVDIGDLGLDVSVLCLEGSPIHEDLLNRKEVKVLPLGFRPRNYFDFKMRAEMGRMLANGINLVHCHQTSILGSIVPWLWSKPNVAVIATRHMMNQHNKNNPFHGAIYSRLDALIVMSETLRQNVLETHPILERRVKVVNLGLDFNRFNPQSVNGLAQRALWGAGPETVVIGVVGRIDPAKGQATFIKAAAGLLKGLKSGEKLKFVIVGEETLGSVNSHLESLKEMVAQFRMEEYVTFAGYQENVPEVMSGLDIFVMPSRQETFGLVAIEAMAMERPVVISTGGSAQEIVGANEEFGLLIRPDDAFDLQRRLRYLLDNPEERVRMGQKARGHVLRNYDRVTRVRKTLELYERALRRRGNP
ncbi:MAG: hypothetical protein A2428_05055 [Bdellovibrionales bacterium RIFOXYC1_FULL_54_43]|nr:MAG: hypothetical protein A2428_05055 [Bdellovibrionales bacterium RIFOXYC1_FULL_54_43]OFZ78560.1 MAG: hypothetical protein A2603_01890 [Bdellovibrionales bacterium RIFOXYD1_FULL_55_31]